MVRKRPQLDLDEEKRHLERLWDDFISQLSGDSGNLIAGLMEKINIVDYKILKRDREQREKKIAAIQCDRCNTETIAAENRREFILQVLEEFIKEKDGNT